MDGIAPLESLQRLTCLRNTMPITDAAAVVILLIIKHGIQWYKLYDCRMLGNEGVPVNIIYFAAKHQGWRNSPS